MKILVTGSAGYIGGTFSFEALKRGHKIIGIDNFSNSNDRIPKVLEEKFENTFSFSQIDLAHEPEKINILMEASDPDVVIHFAGLKAVGESEDQPILYWENNLLSSINLLAAMKKNNKSKIVFSSSATVYGSTDVQPINEAFQIQSMSTYGSTKIAIEQLLDDAAKAQIADVISLRYFNPVGAHKEKIIFENPFDSPNNLMPRIIRVGLSIDKKISIFGNDYDTRDGTGERDYIHVMDLVDGHFAAIEYVMKSKGSIKVNLGTGKSTTVKELIKTFEDINETIIPHTIAPRRQGDVGSCYADASLAKKLLGWEAKHSLKEMCKDAWEAVKNES